MIDLIALSDADLDTLIAAAAAERLRRQREAEIPAQVDALVAEYQAAQGRTDGEPWQQPTSALDAYRAGAVVTHDGKKWESLIGANVWQPGASGWREVVAEGTGPAEWVQPTGSHDVYKKGDLVTFEGGVYRSLIDSNVWSPASYPAGWEEIT